ncbi:acyl-CoA dehydrogenase [Streptomyces sp. NPDC059928]|uniref:acyl-CoA dehydrogenase family protein n=1 Tax=unclassified Streptomyces TaxID=2593676 RepID=UPI003648E685
MNAPSFPCSVTDPLYELVHGDCAPSFLAALHQALSHHPAPAAPQPTGRDARLTARLRRLTRALPPARELFRSPAQLAALIAWSAAAEPALCMTVINHSVLGLGSLISLAPEHGPLRAQFESLETARAKCSYLVTEIGQSNSHLATRTVAEFDVQTREFILTTPDQGAVKFSSTAAHGIPRVGVALARLTVEGKDCGVFPFLVELSDASGPLPGVRMTGPVELGALPLDYAYVCFTGVRLPWEHWLRDDATISEDGAFHDPLGSADRRLARTLCVGQALWATLPAAAAALARQAGVGAVRYARRRRTQGRLAPGTPLLDYRSQQHAVLGAMADAFALTCAAAGALELWAASRSPQRQSTSDGTDLMGFAPWSAVSRPLSAYKAHSIREAARITALCQRHCGFAGFLDSNRLTSYRGFLDAFEPAGGDSQLICYDLGRALADEATAPSSDDVAPLPSLQDPRWWPMLLRRHTQELARRLTTRRDAFAAAGHHAKDSFAVWNPLLDEAAELGSAHAALLAADDVTRTLSAITDPETRSRLEPLAALHGALAARRHVGSLLAAGTLAPTVLDELPQVTDLLCDAVLPHLRWLEDAFALPSDVVRAPLGAEDYGQALAQTLTWKHGVMS